MTKILQKYGENWIKKRKDFLALVSIQNMVKVFVGNSYKALLTLQRDSAATENVQISNILWKTTSKAPYLQHCVKLLRKSKWVVILQLYTLRQQ